MDTNFACGLRAVYPDDEDFAGYQKYLNILMHIIQSPASLCHILVAEEWKQLFVFMDILYGDTLKIWLGKYHCLSEEEIALCYFCYIGIKHRNQAVVFGISPRCLSKRKQRLRSKLMIPQGMSFKDAVSTM